MNKTSLMSAVLASALTAFGACAHPPQPPPPPPSPCPTPEPAQGHRKARGASLDRILDGDRAVLGEDFVSVQEITLYPGEKAAPTMVRGEGTTNLAVVAMFRRPVGPSWRAIRKLPPPDPQHCHGTVGTPAAVAASQLKFTLEDSRVDMR